MKSALLAWFARKISPPTTAMRYWCKGGSAVSTKFNPTLNSSRGYTGGSGRIVVVVSSYKSARYRVSEALRLVCPIFNIEVPHFLDLESIWGPTTLVRGSVTMPDWRKSLSAQSQERGVPGHCLYPAAGFLLGLVHTRKSLPPSPNCRVQVHKPWG
jgi:hypothetical protein